MRPTFLRPPAPGSFSYDSDYDASEPATPTASVFPITDDFSPSPNVRDGVPVANGHMDIRLREILTDLTDRNAAFRGLMAPHSELDMRSVSSLQLPPINQPLHPSLHIQSSSLLKRPRKLRPRPSTSTIRSSPSGGVSRAFAKLKYFLRPSSALDRAAASSAQATMTYATCTRCGTAFKRYFNEDVDGDIILYNEEECAFHPGSVEEWVFHERCMVGSADPSANTKQVWSCCTGDLDAVGCYSSARHRCEDDPVDVFPGTDDDSD